MSLQDELQALQTELDRQTPPEINGILEDLILDLQQNDYASKEPPLGQSIVDWVLPNIYINKQVGEKIQDFILKSHLGEEVQLGSNQKITYPFYPFLSL